MTLPSVGITEIDGALGISASAGGELLAVIGPASTGTANIPAAFGRVKDLTNAFGVGEGVEVAASAIERYGKAVIFVRTACATNQGTYSAVTLTGTGTSVVTADAAVKPYDSYEVRLKIITGGTIGVAGIVFQWSLDAGRNYSANVALGTGANYTITAGNVKLNFAAGNFVAGDVIACTTTGPSPTASEIGLAMDGLTATSQKWGMVLLATPLDGTNFDTMETKIAANFTAGRPKMWMGSFRIPNAGETEAQYLAAFKAIFDVKGSTVGAVGAGGCKMISSVTTGRKYRRPALYLWGPKQASVAEEINIASVNLGSLPGGSIRDDNGNADEHDEAINPGLDDARAVTLRTWNEVQGIYVTRPRIFCPDGSDFTIIPYRRVINLTEVALRAYLVRRLNQAVRVNAKTGYIEESEALEIEAGANAAMASAITGKASSWSFVLSRTDNILSTKTITGDARVVPLGYPEFAGITVGFVNPANQIVKV